MSWKKRFENKKIIIQQTSELLILVWGPGPNSNEPDHILKRQMIREKLEAEFPKSTINFSEDVSIDQQLQRAHHDYDNFSQTLKQTLQLDLCDACIILDSSAGPREECGLALKNSANYQKVFVLTHQKHQFTKSICSEIRANFKSYFYSDQEFIDCNLTDRAVDHVIFIALT